MRGNCRSFLLRWDAAVNSGVRHHSQGTHRSLRWYFRTLWFTNYQHKIRHERNESCDYQLISADVGEMWSPWMMKASLQRQFSFDHSGMRSPLSICKAMGYWTPAVCALTCLTEVGWDAPGCLMWLRWTGQTAPGLLSDKEHGWKCRSNMFTYIRNYFNIKTAFDIILSIALL